MIGILAMSGSAAIRLKKRVMAAAESSMPSSMFTSRIWAPLSTCCLATASASSYLPARMSLSNFGEPVTFVRSPTFTKFVSGRTVSGSKPERRRYGSTFGTGRGATPATAAAMAFTYSGVVPQQPPTKFKKPARANSPRSAAIDSGVSSKPPKALGRPAFG